MLAHEPENAAPAGANTGEAQLGPQLAVALGGLIEAEVAHPIEPLLVELLTTCCPALQMRDHRLATGIIADWPAEVERLRTTADRYATRLKDELLAGPGQR